jgi:hypothetical protein
MEAYLDLVQQAAGAVKVAIEETHVTNWISIRVADDPGRAVRILLWRNGRIGLNRPKKGAAQLPEGLVAADLAAAPKVDVSRANFVRMTYTAAHFNERAWLTVFPNVLTAEAPGIV